MDHGGVIIRPIAPEDRDALRAAFDRLSPESRYRRFFGPMPALSERDLNYLTQVDHRDHEALVAIDEITRDIVGVARFVRTGDEDAEPAIVVGDDWQRRGIATRLLDCLVARAREESIIRFRAPVLAGNPDAMRVLSRLGPTVRTSSGHLVELEIRLAPEEQARSRLRSLLRTAADGTLVPALTLLQRILWRPPQTPLDRESLRNGMVVGTDGSRGARTTVLRAAELALIHGARLELVDVDKTSPETPASSGGDPETLARELRAMGLSVAVHVRRGGPVAALVEVAAEQAAGLIVVDASAQKRPGRLLAGDVPHAIARHATCDVLLLR